jgi:Protein of unknown function (DUF3703)
MRLSPKQRRTLAQALMKEVSSYTQARMKGDHERILLHLGRAHVISQYKWYNHFYIHFLMLEYSLNRKDWQEVCGQLIRILATIPGHLFNRIPIGNIGWSTVPLSAKLPLPDDLKNMFKTETSNLK